MLFDPKRNCEVGLLSNWIYCLCFLRCLSLKSKNLWH